MNQLLAALAAAVSSLANVANRAVDVIATQASTIADLQANPGGVDDPTFVAAMTDVTNGVLDIASKLTTAVTAAGVPSGNAGALAVDSGASSPDSSLVGSIPASTEPVAQAGAVQ
jgi:hypothetical protein